MTKNHMLTIAGAISVLLATAIPQSGTALAQSSSHRSYVIEEVVVTARKKTESLQEVPISIAAFNRNSIRENGFTDSLSIDEKVPNLEMKTFGGQPNIFIRGVGNNDYNATTVSPVSIYVDDVVMGLTGSQLSQLYDLDRIEILRGPQGTLFGRNTTGGAITYHSARPAPEFQAGIRATVGEYDQRDFEGYLNLPVNDTLMFRLAGLSRNRDGDRINLYDGEDANGIETLSGRLSLRYLPSDSLQIDFNVHAHKDKSDFNQGKPVGTFGDNQNVLGYADPFPDDSRKLNFNGKNKHDIDASGTVLTLVYDLDSITLKSITAFEQSETEFCGDFDHSPVSLDEICFLTDGDQFSQEINVNMDINDKLDMVSGLFYLQEDLAYDTFADLFGALPVGVAVPLRGGSERETTTYALFAELDYLISNDWSVNAGLRYTHEKKDAQLFSSVILNLFNPAAPDLEVPIIPQTDLSEDWGAVSGRLAVDYTINDDVMAYGSISRGFKSGGFNLGAFFDPNELTTVDPEYLTSYELGLKSTLMDNRVRFNLATFFYDYTDLQVLTFVSGSTPANPLVFALENASDARVWGVEAELTAYPVDGLEFIAGVGYLDTKYKNFDSMVGGDLSGNSLPGAPEWNISTSLAYDFNLSNNMTLRLYGDYTYTDHRYFNSFQQEAISSRGDHHLFGARISLLSATGNWDIALWGKNLTDEEYVVDSTDLSGVFGFIPLFYGDRRAYGVDFSYRYQ